MKATALAGASTSSRARSVLMSGAGHETSAAGAVSGDSPMARRTGVHAKSATSGAPGTLAWLLDVQAANAAESGDRYLDARKIADFPRRQYPHSHSH